MYCALKALVKAKNQYLLLLFLVFQWFEEKVEEYSTLDNKLKALHEALEETVVHRRGVPIGGVCAVTICVVAANVCTFVFMFFIITKDESLNCWLIFEGKSLEPRSHNSELCAKSLYYKPPN